jgi:hypothetical protein
MSDVRGNVHVGNSETRILCQREHREQRNNDLMSDVRGNIGNRETMILCQMLEGT